MLLRFLFIVNVNGSGRKRFIQSKMMKPTCRIARNIHVSSCMLPYTECKLRMLISVILMSNAFEWSISAHTKSSMQYHTNVNVNYMHFLLRSSVKIIVVLLECYA